jgi:hypothetical protein
LAEGEAAVSADAFLSAADTRAYLDSLPEPSDEMLAALDAEPTTTDEIEIPDDDEWRDSACD